MKDLTSTSFGLIIAFLLPGLVALFALSYWMTPLRDLFATFRTAQSNIGLFLLVLLAAIAASLEVTLIRWLLFEVLVCRRFRLMPEVFKCLGTEGKLSAFRGAVEEHYRYHQFWGGMSIVLPILYVGWAREIGAFPISWSTAPTLALFLVLEGVTVAGAIKAYTNYVERAKHIMRGDENA